MRPLADAAGENPPDDSDISARYPVVWCEASGPTYAGSLVLGPSSLTLDGRAGRARDVVELPYAQLVRVHMAGGRGERIRGRPTLLVETAKRNVRIAAVNEAGAMSEVADVLTRAIPVA